MQTNWTFEELDLEGAFKEAFMAEERLSNEYCRVYEICESLQGLAYPSDELTEMRKLLDYLYSRKQHMSDVVSNIFKLLDPDDPFSLENIR